MSLQTLRHKRHQKIRHAVIGTAVRPRLSVYRGNRHLYVQIIDDATQQTLLGLSDIHLSDAKTGTQRAAKLGDELAKQVKDKKIKSVVFDRGGFRYHGQIKIIADRFREAGIQI